MERLTSSPDYTSLTMEVTGKTSREHDISFKDSERTNVIINCDPCENEGDEQPAEGFCENCQEYLCASCFKIHRRPAVWRHHVLLDKENMPSSKTTKEQLNYECTEPCSEHSTEVLEYFCQTHSQLGCPVCITTKHRMCNDFDYIPAIADKFKESTEVKETYKTLQSLKDDINTYSAIVSKDKMKVKTYEKNAKEHILQLRDEFDSICNRLVDNVEHVSKCDESNIEDSLKICEEILNKIKLRQSILEKKQAEMKVSQLFTEAKLSQLCAKEYRRELETIKECTKSRHYEIKCDIEALREMIKLTFRDQLTKHDPPCAKDSSEDEYLQTNTKKLGHIHDLKFDSTTDRREKNEENKSGFAREQFKSPAERQPETREKRCDIKESLRECENSEYETKRKSETQEYREHGKERLRECESSKYELDSMTDCVLKNEEKNSGDERKHSKTPVYEYKNIRLDSMTDCVLKNEEKNSGDERKHSKTPVYGYKNIRAERAPQKQEDRGYGNKGVAYCEDSTYEKLPKKESVAYSRERQRRC